MDPITIAIASAVATSVATRTSESASTAIKTLISRIRNRLHNTPVDLEDEEDTARALDQEFARDSAFEQECRALWNQAQGDAVSNSFTGHANNVIQARDVHGGITIN